MSDEINPQLPRLPDYLPYEYRKKDDFDNDTDLLKLLKAFDRLLLGAYTSNQTDASLTLPAGLEETIAALANFFMPLAVRESDTVPAAQAPDEFIPWLSQWVALALRADIPLATQRALIAQMIPLYQTRGTKQNMIDLLKAFTNGKSVSVTDSFSPPIPHYFEVRLDFTQFSSNAQIAEYKRLEAIAHSVIALAKPAHTYCELLPKITALRIGLYNQNPDDPKDPVKKYEISVGKNTVVGTLPIGSDI